jgi:hypothetical protein
MVIPLALAAFTHLWNPIGFPPGPLYDESIYLRRAMHLLEGHGPQESEFYDHPFFGQLFLAATLRTIDYPHSLHPSVGDVHSIEMLWLIPRLLMGILAVVDTFLIYKISEWRYNRTVAVIAAILFAVMPISWLTRWVLLDSILLPFLLLSILFAVYLNSRKNNNNNSSKKIPLTLISGIFLGLAIFTKIPAFVMIPVIGFLIYTSNNGNKSLKTLGLWLIPVVLIPVIWPTYAMSVDQLYLWVDGIYTQTHRGKQTLFYSINYDFKIDSMLPIFGMAGLVFAAIRRDLFLVLWAIPFLIFLYVIGFVSYWHFIPLIPAFCIAAARLIVGLPNRISNKKIHVQKTLPFIITSVIGIFGLVSTIMLISTSNNNPYFKAAAFVPQYLQKIKNNDSNHVDSTYYKLTIIANPFYLWVPQYVFHLDHDYIGYYDNTTVKTKKLLSILDEGFVQALNNHQAASQIEQLQANSNIYNSSRIAAFEENNYNNRISIYLYQIKK